MNTHLPSAKYSAWNPGLESQLPPEYLPLSTIFRPENVSTSAAKAYELSDFCGLPAEELVAFRVQRLIVHELLIHVTTGIAVPDGRDDEDLGRNFRVIATTILDRYIVPHREDVVRVFEQLKHRASGIIAGELVNALAPPKMSVDVQQAGHSRWLFGFNKSKKMSPQPSETLAEHDQRILSEWQEKSQKTDDRLKSGCFAALHRIATAVISQRGRLLGDKRVAQRTSSHIAM